MFYLGFYQQIVLRGMNSALSDVKIKSCLKYQYQTTEPRGCNHTSNL